MHSKTTRLPHREATASGACATFPPVSPKGAPVWRRPLLALLASACIAPGCGAIYTPQEVGVGRTDYGYHRTDDFDVEVIPLTFVTARRANADGYVPRSLPTSFDARVPGSEIAVRERMSAAGLDVIEPALTFDPPAAPLVHDPASDLLPPATRREDLSPLPTVEARGGGVATDLRPGDTARGGPGAAAYARTHAGTDGLDYPAPPPRGAASPRLNPPPEVEQGAYRIGAGDVIGLLSSLEPVGTLAGSGLTPDAVKRLRVQRNGQIFIPQAGEVEVGGLTLNEARRVIFDRLVARAIDFDFGVEILEFNSRSIAVNGPEGARMLPVGIRPLTIGDAVAAAGGLGKDPANAVVRVLRAGAIYEIPGSEFAVSSALAGRALTDGDVVSVSPILDVETALAYFDDQLKLQALRREAALEERTLARQRYEDAAAFEIAQRERIQFDIRMETYRIEADRLRQEAVIARLAAQREADAANEAARLANIAARQDYLDRLRQLRSANDAALRQAEATRRQTLRDNAEAHARVREERRALLEMELREERERLARRAQEREQDQALFEKRIRLGGARRDFVTIAGEMNRQVLVPLPFDDVTTLNNVLYDEARGPNVTTGDSSELYVIRGPVGDSVPDRVTVYHLDASDVLKLSVAAVFEMRPNDIVYVNPQPITKWNRVVSQLLPSTGTFGNVATGITRLGAN